MVFEFETTEYAGTNLVFWDLLVLYRTIISSETYPAPVAASDMTARLTLPVFSSVVCGVINFNAGSIVEDVFWAGSCLMIIVLGGMTAVVELVEFKRCAFTIPGDNDWLIKVEFSADETGTATAKMKTRIKRIENIPFITFMEITLVPGNINECIISYPKRNVEISSIQDHVA